MAGKIDLILTKSCKPFRKKYGRLPANYTKAQGEKHRHYFWKRRHQHTGGVWWAFNHHPKQPGTGRKSKLKWKHTNIYIKVKTPDIHIVFPHSKIFEIHSHFSISEILSSLLQISLFDIGFLFTHYFLTGVLDTY